MHASPATTSARKSSSDTTMMKRARTEESPGAAAAAGEVVRAAKQAASTLGVPAFASTAATAAMSSSSLTNPQHSAKRPTGLLGLPPAAAATVRSFLGLPNSLALVSTASGATSFLGPRIALRRPASGLTMQSFMLGPLLQRHEGLEDLIIRDSTALCLCCNAWRRGAGVAGLKSLTLAPTDHAEMAPSAIQLLSISMRYHICWPRLERVTLQNMIIQDSKAGRGLVMSQLILTMVLPHVSPALKTLEIKQSHLGILALPALVTGLGLRGVRGAAIAMQQAEQHGNGNGHGGGKAEKAIVMPPAKKTIKLAGGCLPSKALVIAPPPPPQSLLNGGGDETEESTEDGSSSVCFASEYTHSFSSSGAPSSAGSRFSVGTPSPSGSSDSKDKSKKKITVRIDDRAAPIATAKPGHAVPHQPRQSPLSLLPPKPLIVSPLAALVIDSSTVHADGEGALTELQDMVHSVSIADVTIVEPADEPLKPKADEQKHQND